MPSFEGVLCRGRAKIHFVEGNCTISEQTTFPQVSELTHVDFSCQPRRDSSSRQHISVCSVCCSAHFHTLYPRSTAIPNNNSIWHIIVLPFLIGPPP